MSRNFFGKKILTSLLAVVMLVSLVAVPAIAHIPAEYDVVGGRYIANGFETAENQLAGMTKSNGTFEASNEKWHTGTYSLKVTANTQGNFQFYLDPSKFADSTFGFEPNKKYYLSFWAYSDDDKELIDSFATTWLPYSDVNPTFKKSSSSTTGRQWKKLWTTFETTPNDQSLNYLKLGFYQMGAGKVAYIDDIEIAEITDSAVTTNAVPASASVTKQGYMDGSKTSSASYGVYTYAVDTKAKATYDNAYFGNSSYKVESVTAGAALDGQFYVYPERIFDTNNLVRDKWYYASFYVYVPGAAADVSLKTISGRTVVSKKTIPEDTWVKLSGLIDLSTDTTSNYWIWGLNIDNTTATVAYVDDLVIAELSAKPEEAALKDENLSVNSLGKGSLTLTSTGELDEASVVPSAFTFTGDGAVTDVELNASKTEAYVSFDLGNAESDTLAVSVKDIFGRTVTGSFEVNNANLLKALNSDTSFEGKQYKRVTSLNDGVSTTDGEWHYSASEKRNGNTSVAMKFDADGDNKWYYWNEYGYPEQNDFTLKNGKKYYYEFYAKIADEATTGSCDVYTVLNGAYDAGTATVAVGKDGWTKVSNVLDFTKVNAPSSQGIVIVPSKLSDGEIVYIDDFEIYEIPANHNFEENFYVDGDEVVIAGDKATASLTLSDSYLGKESVTVRVILATYNGDTLVDADVADAVLSFGDEAEIELSADKGETSRIFVWKWPDLTPLRK